MYSIKYECFYRSGFWTAWSVTDRSSSRSTFCLLKSFESPVLCRLNTDPDLIRSRRHYMRNAVAAAFNNAIQRSLGASRPIEIPYTRCILTKEYPVISRLIRRHLPDGREQVDAWSPTESARPIDRPIDRWIARSANGRMGPRS